MEKVNPEKHTTNLVSNITDHLSENLNSLRVTKLQVPVIDLQGIERKDRRYEIVKEVRYAAEEWGFFQVVSHGIPLEVVEKMLDGCRMFHGQDDETKNKFFSPTFENPITYNNTLLSKSQHLLVINNFFDSSEIPEICRDVTVEYLKHATKLGDTVLESLSAALGLKPSYLKEESESNKEWAFWNTYYPVCPPPQSTLGIKEHTDESFITMLAQDQIGGLQVLYQDQWVDVQPIPGAIGIVIGDLLQIVSNDRFKSVHHRVDVNRNEPRVSAGLFLVGVWKTPKIYGPIKELLSEKQPPMYTEFTLEEYNKKAFFSVPGEKLGPECVKLETHHACI